MELSIERFPYIRSFSHRIVRYVNSSRRAQFRDKSLLYKIHNNIIIIICPTIGPADVSAISEIL